jgi:predicted nucleic acid-binding protein
MGGKVKLVDTSSWIEYLRDLGSPAGKRVEELVVRAEAALCDMVSVELWHGARGSRERRELAELERDLSVLSIDTEAWERARKLASRCREAGITAPPADIVIAACASRYGLELEHSDAHFQRILPIAAKL